MKGEEYKLEGTTTHGNPYIYIYTIYIEYTCNGITPHELGYNHTSEECKIRIQIKSNHFRSERNKTNEIRKFFHCFCLPVLIFIRTELWSENHPKSIDITTESEKENENKID